MRGLPTILGVVLALGVADVGLADPVDDCFDSASTQRQLDLCAGLALKRSREQLAFELRHTRSALHGELLRNFEASQKAWENWLELQCFWEASRAAGGSIDALLIASCRAEHTRLRADRLQQLRCVDGLVETDCPEP